VPVRFAPKVESGSPHTPPPKPTGSAGVGLSRELPLPGRPSLSDFIGSLDIRFTKPEQINKRLGLIATLVSRTDGVDALGLLEAKIAPFTFQNTAPAGIVRMIALDAVIFTRTEIKALRPVLQDELLRTARDTSAAADPLQVYLAKETLRAWKVPFENPELMGALTTYRRLNARLEITADPVKELAAAIADEKELSALIVGKKAFDADATAKADAETLARTLNDRIARIETSLGLRIKGESESDTREYRIDFEPEEKHRLEFKKIIPYGRLVGQGGSADVYYATDVKSDARAAIKVLPVEARMKEKRVTSRRRLEQEYEILSRAELAKHPNFMTVHNEGELSVGEGPGTYFFAMKLMDPATEPTLDRFIAHPERYGVNLSGPAGEKILLDLLTQLIVATAFAAKLGIVNRDIKPQNMFISIIKREEETIYRLVISDFGIAKDFITKSATAPETTIGKAPGTPEYMPPFYVEYDRESTRIGDIQKLAWHDKFSRYAIGIIAYKMFNGGVHPFADFLDKDVVEFIRAAREGKVTHNLSRIPPYLLGMVKKLLVFHQDNTYQNWEDLVKDVRLADVPASTPSAADIGDGPTDVVPPGSGPSHSSYAEPPRLPTSMLESEAPQALPSGFDINDRGSVVNYISRVQQDLFFRETIPLAELRSSLATLHLIFEKYHDIEFYFAGPVQAKLLERVAKNGGQ
jgi:serine/threonine protein kinase